VSDTDAVRLPVEGMTCGSCVARIERTVKKIVGVQAVRVSLRDETMTVRREPAQRVDRHADEAEVHAGHDVPDSAGQAELRGQHVGDQGGRGAPAHDDTRARSPVPVNLSPLSIVGGCSECSAR
jgi:copper chaperone CopZ